MDTRVSIVRCSDYSGVKGAIKEALNLIGGLLLNKTSVKIVDYKFKGTGTVVTFSIVRTASSPYDLEAPFPVAIIELDEGTRMTAPVVCGLDEIYIGMPVKQTFRKIVADGESGTIVYGTKFVPA